MIKIVHWKEIVGQEFLDKFVKISRDLYFAAKKGRYEEELKKIADADLELFRKKHSFMRHCGYEIKDRFYHERGWFGFPIVEGKEIKFRYSADREQAVEYISLPAFLNLKRNLEQDSVENEYYQKAEPEELIEKVKPRADIDGDFPSEVRV